MNRWIIILLLFLFFLTFGLLGCVQKEAVETKTTPVPVQATETLASTPMQTQITLEITPAIDINTTLEDIEKLINELNELENISFNLE